jgi:hypothetical protein
MIDLGYQFEGIDQTLARLAALREMRGLDTELEAAGDATLPKLRTYPPEVPKQRYIRKYRFRDSWKRQDARRVGGAVEVDLSNDTPYGPLLVGDEQAEPMKGRWWKLRTVADDQRGQVRARVQTWALRTWRGQ